MKAYQQEENVRHLVVGAGATFAEALALGNAPEVCPPLIRDFARKTWQNYSPHPVLEAYLRSIGFEDHPNDPRELFYKLEATGIANIERFMEFAWQNRNKSFQVSKELPPGYISGLKIVEAGPNSVKVGGGGRMSFWDNLLWHGIGSPLQFSIIQCFYENGTGARSLDVTKSVIAKLVKGDLVLNLNYDTVFEMALNQSDRTFSYAPTPIRDNDLLVCKPHGSLNLVSNDRGFMFGQPEWLGMPEPPNYRSYSGLVPPRLNKQYDQHPIARAILAAAGGRRPQVLTMWGVGLTESDADLLALYRRWAGSAASVEIINPSVEVANQAGELLNCEVRHFESVPLWLMHE